MDVARDLRRGAVRLYVLHHAAERAVNGAWVSAELDRRRYHISPGTLYPLLRAMVAAGLLVSEEGVESSRVRRYYTATAEGRRVLTSGPIAAGELAQEVLPPPRAPTSRPRRRGDDCSAGGARGRLRPGLSVTDLVVVLGITFGLTNRYRRRPGRHSIHTSTLVGILPGLGDRPGRRA